MGKNIKFEARKEMFAQKDISEEKWYEGKILVLSKTKIGTFHEEFKTPQNQLFVAGGGFGCSPLTMGTAVVGKFLSDGEACRMERHDFIGVLKNEVANELGLCPCGNTLHEEEVMNALSRTDNETYICKECENAELQKELDALAD